MELASLTTSSTKQNEINEEDSKIPLINNMDNNQYVQKQEKKCSRLLKRFNEKMEWFKDLHPNEENSIIDFYGIDKKGRKCHIELKERKANIDSYETILLDATKVYGWAKIGMSGATNNEQRLYFNFMNDGIVIFDMNNQSEMMFYPNHKQWNPAKNEYEHRDKLGLPLKNAIIFRYTPMGLEREKNERYNKTKQC